MKFQEMSPDKLLGPLNKVELKHAPKSLFVAGNVDLCRDFARISIIGTREVSPLGLRRTQSLVKMLVKRNIVIVSGLARGVDTCAHKTAIESGGHTIAVLGTPLDHFYPMENENLQREIMAKHVAVSQFPHGSPIQRKNFVLRNRTMALLSHATIIVEAGEGSGTLHQGWEALRLGRPLFLMESLTKDSELKWPREMLDYGAHVLTRDNIDVLAEYVPQEILSGSAQAVPF